MALRAEFKRMTPLIIRELLREGTFLIGEGEPGYFRNFWQKKSWPSQLLEWINA